ncbi:LOW QUALITY PROTEIN: reverse transcriptase [Phytophthora megakarya]|uniref:Reverse transcriptase n=1 Tax=Phytophthora megakarya TaxID=4795 RepID=A0A225W868_9STRA|nr:LOW QUALITY PROTEIN: reverse transcriptase [Phytophthora megakarya]
MVYPMPLISDLMEDLDKVLWYCSLDMANVFWVVPMPDRSREISAFITPFGLFEWRRMPFGLKCPTDLSTPRKQRTTGIVDDHDRGSSLGRRSCIDNIIIAAESWDQMCRRVEDLLEVDDKWNLSISVAKSLWGMDKDIWDTECDQRTGGEPKRSEILDRSAISSDHFVPCSRSWVVLNY